MTHRQTNPARIAAAKSGFSGASAYRLEKDPRLLSTKKTPRERRRPDPSCAVWDSEIVPLLKAAPGLRPVAIFEEINVAIQSLALGCAGPLSAGSALGARYSALNRR